MVEKLQSDASTPLPLEQHLQKVETAISAAMNNPTHTAGAPNAGGGSEDAMIDAILTSPIQSASMFVAIADQLGGSSNGNPLTGGKKKHTQSHFLGGSGYKDQGIRPSPLMPHMSYAEKRAAVKRQRKAAAHAFRQGKGKSASRGTSIFASERLALTSMSLTGGSMTGGKARPMKGAKVDLAVAAMVGLGGLVKELNRTLKMLKGNNRYNGSSGMKRLEKDLKAGNPAAENLVQQKPVLATKVLSPA